MKSVRREILLLAVALIHPFTSSGAEPRTIRWKVDGAVVDFVRYDDSRLTISKSCLQTGGYLKCDAIRALNAANMAAIPPERLEGGKNPGSVLCQQVGGTVVFGSSESGQSTFCRFGDGSAVEGGSLYAAAIAKGGA